MKPQPARFNNLEEAVNYIAAETYIKGHPLRNMVITTEDSIMETTSTSLRSYRPLRKRNKSPTTFIDEEKNLLFVPETGWFMAALETFDRVIVSEFPDLPYMIEFNIPSPFLKVDRRR